MSEMNRSAVLAYLNAMLTNHVEDFKRRPSSVDARNRVISTMLGLDIVSRMPSGELDRFAASPIMHWEEMSLRLVEGQKDNSDENHTKKVSTQREPINEQMTVRGHRRWIGGGAGTVNDEASKEELAGEDKYHE